MVIPTHTTNTGNPEMRSLFIALEKLMLEYSCPKSIWNTEQTSYLKGVVLGYGVRRAAG
jgi:hypothetical protein